MTPPVTLLALSFAPGCTPGERAALRSAAHGLLAASTPGAAPASSESPAAVLADDDDVLVLASGLPEPQPADAPDGDDLLVTLSHGAHTLDGRRLDRAGLRRALAGDSAAAAAGIAPPFAACHRAGPGAPLELVTDRVGLKHVYRLQRPRWAAVSTSSALLARLGGASLDVAALGGYALTGSFVARRTPFASVLKLPPGGRATLAAGRFAVRAHPEATAPRRLPRPEALPPVARVVRQRVAACLAAEPSPLLELSGGLDSRMLLAAIPPADRRGLRALTIGPAASADHRIAAAIARRYGLEHQRVTLDGLARATPAEAAALVAAAARARDYSGNPLSLAVLDWQERQVDQAPRLTGQNGEFARGFYYAGQRAHPAATPDLVDALARWRLFTNDAVDAGLFAPGVLDEQRAELLRGLRLAFRNYDGDWLAATDEHYLRERMQRWVGVAFSTACTRRTILAPFFHEPYLAWARGAAPADKRGSRLFAAVLARLDAELAAVPLDGGRTPRGLASQGPAQRLAAGVATARKAARKLDQRLRGRGRPAAGAAALGALLREHWRERDGALDDVAGLDFLDGDAVAAVAAGTRPVGAASVAFLANLEGILAAGIQPRR